MIPPGETRTLQTADSNGNYSLDYVIKVLKEYVDNHAPTVKAIKIINATKTATVTLTVADGVLYVTVTNTEEDEKFRL